MTVVDLEVEPVEEIIFAPVIPAIVIDVEDNQQEVDQYVEIIKESETTKKVEVKKVVKVEKEVHSFYEKVYTEVIDSNDQTQYVTLIVKPGDKPVIVNVEE